MRTSHRLAFGLLLAASTLSAGDFGAQFGAQQATGNLKDATDSKIGYTLGVHMDFDLAPSHTLRPRLDYGRFPSASASYGFTDPVSGDGYQVDSKLTFDNVALGLDYLYRPGGRPQGFYLLAGLGASRWKNTYDLRIQQTGAPDFTTHSDSNTGIRLGYAVGAGWQFDRRWGAELRYAGTKSDSGGSDFTTVTLGATVRF